MTERNDEAKINAELSQLERVKLMALGVISHHDQACERCGRLMHQVNELKTTLIRVLERLEQLEAQQQETELKAQILQLPKN